MSWDEAGVRESRATRSRSFGCANMGNFLGRNEGLLGGNPMFVGYGYGVSPLPEDVCHLRRCTVSMSCLATQHRSIALLPANTLPEQGTPMLWALCTSWSANWLISSCTMQQPKCGEKVSEVSFELTLYATGKSCLWSKRCTCRKSILKCDWIQQETKYNI